MSLDKAEIKMGTAHELGVRYDDKLEGAKKEVNQYAGAEHALRQAMKSVDQLKSHVDRDIDEGKLDDVDTPLKVGEAIKRYIQRCVGSLDNLATTAQANAVRAQGKVEALESVVKETKSFYDAEQRKLEARIQALKEAEEGAEESSETDPKTRVEGTHPGNPLGARRAEAEKEKAAAKSNGKSSGTKAAASKRKAPTKKAPVKAKRGGKNSR